MGNFIKDVHSKLGPTDHYLAGAFLYTLLTTLVFQLFIFPHMPSISTNLGILKGDNELFHQLALEMAGNIKMHGWHEWRLFPLNIAAGINVGILAVLYVLFGARPYLILPLNALLHALSFIFLYKIFYELGKNKKWALLSSIPFLILPSSLLWTSQLHKDNYAILAWVLFFYSLIKIESAKPLKFLFCTSMATLLLILVRPLYLHLTLSLSIPLVIIYVVAVIRKKKSNADLLNAALFLIVAFCGYVSFKLWSPVSSAKDESHFYLPSYSTATEKKCTDYHWADSFLPAIIEKQHKAVAGIRIKQICSSAAQSTSTIDEDFLPNSTKDLLSYLPRAFVISQVFPTPLLLLRIKKLQVIPVIFEMLLYYCFLPFIFMIFIRSKKLNIIAAMTFSLLSEIFLAYIIPNMGSYHRIRYPFFAFLLGLGIFSCLTYFNGKKREKA